MRIAGPIVQAPVAVLVLAGSPLGEGDVIADPRFVDLEKHDLHLRPDSPAIDSAAQTGHNIDFDGHSMPIGEAPDIGAYEYQEGSR